VTCHDGATKVSQLVTNVDYTGYQCYIPSNITLLGAPDLIRIRPIDLVIFRWSCQGLSPMGMGQGLSNPKFSLFWELICVVQYLQ
jgi:site-specific DNA-cytosine methylase